MGRRKGTSKVREAWSRGLEVLVEMEMLEQHGRGWMSDGEMLGAVDDEDFAERVESLLGKLEDKGGRTGEDQATRGSACSQILLIGCTYSRGGVG